MTEKEVYTGNYIRVTEEQIGDKLYERGYFTDGIVLFPFNEKNELILIKEKRVHGTSSGWRLITGYNEKNLPLKTIANQELQEEAGLKSNNISQYLFLKRQGSINRVTKYAICTDLKRSKLENPDGDVILEVKAFPIKKVQELALEGKLHTDQHGYVLLKLCHDFLQGKLPL
jgi:ADP-ribose pyrophosphatase YjhB (NUDIX family)